MNFVFYRELTGGFDREIAFCLSIAESIIEMDTRDEFLANLS